MQLEICVLYVRRRCMLQFCFVVNTFSAKTVSQSGGFIIACSFHFPQFRGFFVPSYFASVLEDFNLYYFSGLRGKGRAHCAELWSRQQISDHLVMDQLVCFSRYSDCTTVETRSFLLWRSRYLIEAAFSRLPSTLVNLTVSYSTLFMSFRGN